MKRLLQFGVILVLIMSVAYNTLACSSFAVYGGNGPIYGMNWDVPSRGEAQQSTIGFFEDYNSKVVISHETGPKFFALLSFQSSLNPFYNEFGLFAAAQYALPPQNVILTRRERSMHWTYFMFITTAFQNTGEVNAKLDTIRLIESTNHFLFADTHRNAIITEPGGERNHILPMQGDYMIMTNFYNHLLENASPEFMESLDSDQRYRSADYMIKNSLKDFDYRDGLSVLAGIKQRITKFSMVVVPEEQQIYIVLFGDFTRIWQVDFMEETIATYQGFKEYRVEQLDSKGITINELMEWK